MKIVYHESVSLTEEEREHLNAAFSLLMEIYDKTKDDGIRSYTDKATDAIACLLDRCKS